MVLCKEKTKIELKFPINKQNPVESGNSTGMQTSTT